MSEPASLIHVHGGYSRLATYRLGSLIYDGTAAFCRQYVSPKDRTFDQMVQAARSGVANIVEGSEASATSKKSELKLTNVAKASQEELLSDYQAFLRQRGLSLWQADSPEARVVRDSRPADLEQLRQVMAELVSAIRANRASAPIQGSAVSALSDKKALLLEVACNTMITLINQETYLLKRQIARLADDFEREGGFTERLYSVRSEYRRKHRSAVSAESAPIHGAVASDQSDKSDLSDKSDNSAPIHGAAQTDNSAPIHGAAASDQSDLSDPSDKSDKSDTLNQDNATKLRP